MNHPHGGTTGRTRLPGVVHVIAAGIFLLGTSEFMIAGLLPEAAADLGVSIARAGLLVTAFAVGMIIGPPVMALATLRLPRRATLVLALLVFAAGHVVAALSGSFAVVTTARAITALATGTFWAVGAVVATGAAGPGANARALAVMSGGLSLAVVAGVPLGTVAGQLTGWRGPFWMLAVLAVLAAAAVLRSMPAASREPAGHEDRPASARAELSALRPWRTWVVLGAIVLAQAGFLGAYSYISPLLTGRAGIPSAWVPVVLAGFGVGALAGTALGGRLGDRRPLATVAGAVALTAAELAVLVLTSTHQVVVVVLVALLGASGLGANPVLIAQVLRHAGRGSTLASSLATAAFNLGTAAGSAVAGATLSSTWELVGPAALGAVVTGSALLPIGLLATRTRRGRPSEHDDAVPAPVG
ncbi:MFS transporter [Saccharopolyspora sp. 6T]|uniref:MFS transporter n=1 Tax=Saccharopolyspora sp. 6T TaxID=2877238 RepID=UPI001CD6B065|nr:MFS transporter [Saccharopolyspora sp. 6T]MCA1185048.1 MFS transporter [Saccharopolyspora sp. 6T]